MTSRDFECRSMCLGVLLLALLIAGAVLVVVSRRKPSASLDGLQPLLATRRFDQAESLIREYLKIHPTSVQGNMLMAQVALERDDQKPRLALDHLGRINARDHATRAIVMLNLGKAYSALGWNDRAEMAWKAALKLEPRVPEAGWNLLGLYYVEGRRAEAHRFGMALRVTEPDPRDRAQLLLELVRHDAQPLGPDSLMLTLEPIVRKYPRDLHMAIALGLALVRNSRVDEGLSNLRDLAERFALDSDARDALLLGLDEAGKFDDLASEMDRLPSAMVSDPRFDRHRGAIAQQRQDWPVAAEQYESAWRRDPSDFRVLYRLSRALRMAGRMADADTFDQKVHAAQDAKDQILPLYEEANAVKTLGTAPHPDIYHRLANLRERMGRDDEAIAWHSMVLEHQPDNKESKAAIARLNAAKADITASH
jgi:tetratricopeptide (TPR) repeat protein